MELFIIGKKEIQDLITIRKNAEENPFCIRQMIEIIDSGGTYPEIDIQFTAIIPIDLKIVLTVEEQPGLIGWTYHLSVSRPRNQFPSVASVNQILEFMGLNLLVEKDLLHIAIQENAGDFEGNPTNAMNLFFKKEKTDQCNSDQS